MPNSYFKFKQFTIHQDKAAMKVCTDACLFGAWVANRLPLTVNRVLDIGTGTGLLSLMLAQKINEANIHAIEIDEAAATQAKENFDTSLWKERLHVHHASVQQFENTANKEYDLIISNPPFYESELKSDDAKRNIALHSAELKLEELIHIAHKLLKDDGSFFVLLPYYRMEKFIQLGKDKFFIKEKALIKQTPKHNYFRSMFWLTKHDVETHHSEIIIVNEEGKYTKEFIELLKAYYLYL